MVVENLPCRVGWRGKKFAQCQCLDVSSRISRSLPSARQAVSCSILNQENGISSAWKRGSDHQIMQGENAKKPPKNTTREFGLADVNGLE